MEPEGEDFRKPVLEGQGASDYERYLRTDELLALQKRAAEQVDRDELLFQTVHQASELWLKLAWNEVQEATRLIERGELEPAERLLRRALLCLDYVLGQLEMLEALSPWEYQAIRKVLGHGSGFDSPGFREIRRVTPQLGQAFHARLREAGLGVVELSTARAAPRSGSTSWPSCCSAGTSGSRSGGCATTWWWRG
jgi:tryptophan 2,3-dioxygenase